MAGDVEILKEYLLSLGFKVDEKSSKAFDWSLGKLDLRALALAKTMKAVALTTVDMVAQFARSMEKMYYSSEKANSTVGNIQALEYAGKQVGLGAGTMQSALEGMARAMRTNPGLQELVESFGIPVKGRDMADVAKDFLKTLTKMDHMVGAQFASMFGIDSDTLFLLTKHADEFERMEAARKKMAADAGLNTEDAAKAGRELAQIMNTLAEKWDILSSTLKVELLPTLKAMADFANKVIDGVTKLSANWGKSAEVQKVSEGSWWDRLKFLMSGNAAKAAMNIVSPSQPTSTGSRISSGRVMQPGELPNALNQPSSGPVAAPTAPPQGGSDPASRLAALEARYGLPKGLLDRVWAKESARGKNKGPSRAGAMGDFQFMKNTWGEWGGGGDINSFEDSSLAAARYLANLSRKYNGDVTKMLAAYNWGQGNVDRKGLGAMPWETRDYVKIGEGLGQISVQSKTDIVVHGTEPASTAKLVANGQEQAARDVARNISKVVMQ